MCAIRAGLQTENRSHPKLAIKCVRVCWSLRLRKKSRSRTRKHYPRVSQHPEAANKHFISCQGCAHALFTNALAAPFPALLKPTTSHTTIVSGTQADVLLVLQHTPRGGQKLRADARTPDGQMATRFMTACDRTDKADEGRHFLQDVCVPVCVCTPRATCVIKTVREYQGRRPSNVLI